MLMIFHKNSTGPLVRDSCCGPYLDPLTCCAYRPDTWLYVGIRPFWHSHSSDVCVYEFRKVDLFLTSEQISIIFILTRKIHGK